MCTCLLVQCRPSHPGKHMHLPVLGSQRPFSRQGQGLAQSGPQFPSLQPTSEHVGPLNPGWQEQVSGSTHAPRTHGESQTGSQTPSSVALKETAEGEVEKNLN